VCAVYTRYISEQLWSPSPPVKMIVRVAPQLTVDAQLHPGNVSLSERLENLSAFAEVMSESRPSSFFTGIWHKYSYKDGAGQRQL